MAVDRVRKNRDGSIIEMIEGDYQTEGEITHEERREILVGRPSINFARDQKLNRGDPDEVICQVWANNGAELIEIPRADPDDKAYSRIQLYFTFEHFGRFVKEFIRRGIFK